MEHSVRLNLFGSLPYTQLTLPLIATPISAGFPSPAADFLEQGIDLNIELIGNPSSTFFAYVEGNSMKGAGIHDGDLIVVDRSEPIENGRVVVCSIDGEFTVKRIEVGPDYCKLIPENDQFEPIHITDNSRARVWGVVTFSIGPKLRPFRNRNIVCTR